MSEITFYGGGRDGHRIDDDDAGSNQRHSETSLLLLSLGSVLDGLVTEQKFV